MTGYSLGQRHEKGMKMTYGLKFGVFTGVAISVYLLILQFAGLITNRALGLVSILLLAAGIVLAQISLRKASGGIMGYGQAFVAGLMTVIVAEVLANIYYFIHLTVISSEIIDFTADTQAMALEQQGMDPAQIEAIVNSPFFSPAGFAVMGLITGTIVGVIIALITAAITKKAEAA
jgi:hypothetical protein